MATVKREISDELERTVKRQQVNENTRRRPFVGTLLNLIPGKKQNKIAIEEKPVTTIGRSRSCDVLLDQLDISTNHCDLILIEVTIDKNKQKLLNIVDHSRNGTYVNGNKLVRKDYILKNGDRIVFGKSCSFLFKYNSTINMTEDNQRPTNNDTVFKKPQFSVTESQILARKTANSRVLSVFDKYAIGKELGSGHYAIVKEGVNKKTGEAVAIKIFHPQLNDDQKKNHQFKEETSILMRVKHPNIVNLLDSFVEPVSKTQIQKYLILEKIDNGELFDRIVSKTKLRQNETKELFRQILSGLKYLHGQNIIHRDIKPENILLNIRKRKYAEEKQLGPWDEDEIEIQVKIADFGLAKFTGEMQFTNTLCGTPSYVAPEVLMKQGYTSKVDMWSAGVLLYVCLCGFPPFSDQLGPPDLKDQILQGKYAFYSPYWDEIDDTVLHLISNLLVVDFKKRFDVDDTIQHPWFSNRNSTTFSQEMLRLQISDNKIPKTYSELSCL